MSRTRRVSHLDVEAPAVGAQAVALVAGGSELGVQHPQGLQPQGGTLWGEQRGRAGSETPRHGCPHTGVPLPGLPPACPPCVSPGQRLAGPVQERRAMAAARANAALRHTNPAPCHTEGQELSRGGGALPASPIPTAGWVCVRTRVCTVCRGCLCAVTRRARAQRCVCRVCVCDSAGTTRLRWHVPRMVAVPPRGLGLLPTSVGARARCGGVYAEECAHTCARQPAGPLPPPRMYVRGSCGAAASLAGAFGFFFFTTFFFTTLTRTSFFLGTGAGNGQRDPGGGSGALRDPRTHRAVTPRAHPQTPRGPLCTGCSTAPSTRTCLHILHKNTSDTHAETAQMQTRSTLTVHTH